MRLRLKYIIYGIIETVITNCICCPVLLEWFKPNNLIEEEPGLANLSRSSSHEKIAQNRRRSLPVPSRKWIIDWKNNG